MEMLPIVDPTLEGMTNVDEHNNCTPEGTTQGAKEANHDDLNKKLVPIYREPKVRHEIRLCFPTFQLSTTSD